MRGILMRMKVKIVWQHCFVVAGNYARINGIQMHVLDWVGWYGIGVAPGKVILLASVGSARPPIMEFKWKG